MRSTKLNIGDSLALLPPTIVLLSFALLSDQIWVSVASFTFYTSYVISRYGNGNLLDPRVSFLGFFLLYSLWFPLQKIILNSDFGILNENQGLLKPTVDYAFIGAAAFVLTFTVLSKKEVANLTAVDFFHRFKAANEYLTEKLIQRILYALVLLGILYALASGASSKREVLDSEDVVLTLVGFAQLALTASVSLSIVKMGGNIFHPKSVFFVAFSTVYMMALGERDALFRFLIILGFFYFDKRRTAYLPVVAGILASAIVAVPVSQFFKAIFLSGSLQISELTLDLILSSEFASASRNLYTLIAYGVDNSLVYLFSDILRGALPSFLSSFFIDLKSSTSWYNKTYRFDNGFDGTSGWGFGLLAQGYLIGDVWGIILIMALVGTILAFITNRRLRSEYWYVFSLLSIATAIYCIRADMANFISQSFKIAGGSVFLIYCCHRIGRRTGL